MNNLNPLPAAAARPEVAAGTVLIVDDSRGHRMLMSRILERMGLRVLSAPSGDAALEICRTDPPDLVVSDWVMPGMDGLELCRKYRETHGGRYGYFILLTSKDDKAEVAHGLDAGADDFLTKPVNPAELRARIRAGQRVVEMERQLTETNVLISDALDEMKRLHAQIDRDLVEAQRLQQSLVRERHGRFGPVEVSLFLEAAGRVGGDLVGMFEVNESEIGVFALDVSGHGIASALMTARLAACLSGNQPGLNIAITRDSHGRPVMRAPAETAARLNDLLTTEITTDQYLTLVLARVELATGRVTFTQAGHPHPAVHRATGEVEFVGAGGMPIGLLPGASFEDTEIALAPGERLFIGSDGITECMDSDGALLGDDGLAHLLRKHRGAAGETLFAGIVADLVGYSGTEEFADDVSVAVIDYTLPGS